MQHCECSSARGGPHSDKKGHLDGFGERRQAPEPLKTDLDEPVLALINGRDEHIEDLLKRYPVATVQGCANW